MSPNPHLPNVNSNPNSVVSSTNSTANIFLGGVRRSWMLNAANNVASTSVSPSCPVTSATTATSSTGSTTTTTTTTAAAASATPADAGRTRQQGMRESSLRVLPVTSPSKENAASVATATTAAAQPQSLPNVMSPVTPGHDQQQTAAPQALPQAQRVISDRAGADPPSMSPAATAASATTINKIPVATQQSTSRPIPNPIVIPAPSYNSPVNVGNHNGASPSVAVSPFPRSMGPAPLSNPPQPREAVPTSSPMGAGGVSIVSGYTDRAEYQLERNGVPQQLQRQSSRASHSSSPVLSPVPPPPAASPVHQVVNQSSAHRRNPFHNPLLEDAFFDHALARIEEFANELRENNCFGHVEQPRVQLLSQACAERDPLFLAIHQVYCLHSLAPQEFFNLPGFTERQARGLDVVRRILVENSRVSGEFLRWAANFPAPLVGLMQRSMYRQAVEQAGQCLNFLADRWPMYVQQVRTRDFPPLVEELVKNFGITSGALAYTFFLSTCRSLTGSKDEEHLKAVWQQDLRYYQRRRGSSRPINNARIQEEGHRVIQKYRSVPVAVGAQHLEESFPLSHMPMSIVGERGLMHPVVRRTSTGSPQIRSPRIPLPMPSQQASSTVQGTTSAPHPHSPLVSTAGSRGPILHPVSRPSGAPISHIINPQISSPISYMPTNPSSSRPASISTASSRHSSWTNGAPSPQYPHPAQISESRSVGTPTKAAVPTSMAHASQIMQQPLSEGRSSSSMQAATPVQHQVATRLQLELRNNGVGPSVQPVNLRRPAQPPHSPFFQGPRPHLHPPPRPLTLLLPPPGPIPVNPAPPLSLRDGLHQAHLRDPHNCLLSPGPAGGKEVELFQYLSSFAVPPMPLGRVKCVFQWKFNLSKTDQQQFPKLRPGRGGQRPLRFYASGNRVYRLRCIKVLPSTSNVAEQVWSVAESVWPSVFYVHVNKVELFARRRVHNGKDLPLDITDHLQEGENLISLHVIRGPAETNDLLYAMGVEILEVSDLARAISLAQPLPAAESREMIRKRVSSDSQDDEVSVVSDHLSINLVDPFTARVFDSPVRGRFCEHQDCFDHMTWVQTRASKSGKRSLKNDWRCPICGQDARPQHLVVDGFLREVHAELARTNQLEGARAILIKADGSWVLKAEADTRSSCERGTGNILGRVPLKRKANDDSNLPPTPQKPKSEWTASINETTSLPQPPEVISLD
ncbi:hypothetical protein BBP40_012560 [Aspergillus hancockii]|nr:hypothetical protein BBP40_012560 [Aspergillus hancockii]